MDKYVPYAELHCHSNFSFLDGASSPEALVEEAVRLELQALALCDHNGFYGVVKFAEAAKKHSLKTVFGAELTVDLLDHQQSQKDPDGTHLLILCRNAEGYSSLSRVISHAQLQGEKGAPRLSMSQLSGFVSPAEFNNWLVLTGCRKGLVPLALQTGGLNAARKALAELTAVFGSENVVAELWDHNMPYDSERNESIYQLSLEASIRCVATNNVHYANLSARNLAMSMAAVRARSSLTDMQGWLPAAASAYMRSGIEQHQRFRRFPGVVQTAAELGSECAFDLSLIAPKLPPYDGTNGLSEIDFITKLAHDGALNLYGDRGARPQAWQQISHELNVIKKLNFAGYFLIVWDIVQFCNNNNIYCQGRGSAANSAVCYVLGITKADAVGLNLLFERFLSSERDGPPDIDLDIESDRRDEVIQYVYKKYGRHYAAQVANVITYKAKSAVRDAAKALGYSSGQQDAYSKAVSRWSSVEIASELPRDVIELAAEFETLPRHLGIHTGGMVICDRPIIEVCPVEKARMEQRTVLQWDKEDCASAGLVKFDLLGLGMLSALHLSVDEIEANLGTPIDLALIPQEEAVYNMLCRADTVGVFQVESRAQMSTLPRLKPRTFYDLVIEIALIRPGPIQGGSVHPYLRRRAGVEPVTYLHPLLKPALEKTLGVPLFQEQLMQIAIDVAGFSAADADELRQAMAAKRSRERMEALKLRLFEGMDKNKISDEIKAEIWDKLAAFADFGFPESHSISFAYLVYASSWLKLHYPAAFCVGLLNSQPMGFYSPHSLVQDAARHGVQTLRACVNSSSAQSKLEAIRGEQEPDLEYKEKLNPPLGDQDKHDVLSELAECRLDKKWAVRLGLDYVQGVGADLAAEIQAAQPYRDLEDFMRRIKPSASVAEALASAGAFRVLDKDRRQALWRVGALQGASSTKLEGIVTGLAVPELPKQSELDIAACDLINTGIAVEGHPTKFYRNQLDRMGVTKASDLAFHVAAKVAVAGVVTHKQRPPTAGGITFMTLEDESGLMNIVVSPGCWVRHGTVLDNHRVLIVNGRYERTGAVVNVVAEKIRGLQVEQVPPSRDFH